MLLTGPVSFVIKTQSSCVSFRNCFSGIGDVTKDSGLGNLVSRLFYEEWCFVELLILVISIAEGWSCNRLYVVKHLEDACGHSAGNGAVASADRLESVGGK
ncbi:hypothetical protein TNCV_2823371 [Trichonephila clavipes]|nr:hypothetical protein TNCV_2823371 [Trichonephila clavipes]